MRRQVLSLCLLLAGVVLFPQSFPAASPAPAAAGLAATSTLFWDDFEGEPGPALDYAGFTNWSVVNGTVDLIGEGFYDFFPEQGLYVDLDGSSGAAGTFQTRESFTLRNTRHYELSYSLAGSQRAWGGLSS